MNKSKTTLLAMVTSEDSIRFDFGNELNSIDVIQEFCRFVETEWDYMIDEVIPSYHIVTVYFLKELVQPINRIEEIITKWENRPLTKILSTKRHIQIPVCYDAKFAFDTDKVLSQTGLTLEELVLLHTTPLYKVYMIGFLPGFPYLGGLPKVLHINRLSKPRSNVPKGAVGIGGGQTGVYPINSPGGWNIIGKTPIDLYSLKRKEPFLIHSGDLLSFNSICIDEFEELKGRLNRNPESITEFVKEVLF